MAGTYTYSASVSNAMEEVWSAAMQKPLFKSLVAKEVAAMELGDFSKGDTYHKPYRDRLSVGDYQDHNDVSIESQSVTDEVLYLDQKKYVAFDSDETNEVISRYDFIAPRAEDAAYQLKDKMDQDLFKEVKNADTVVADDDIGGSYEADGIGAESGFSDSLVKDIYSLARRKLRESNVPEQGGWVSVISPALAESVEKYAVDAGFNVADATLKNGYAGSFMGFDVYVTNNLEEESNSTTTNADNFEHAYFGKSDMITMATNTAPNMEIKDKPKQIGSNFIAWTVYGIKTFTMDSKKFLDVRVSPDA